MIVHELSNMIFFFFKWK